MTLTRIQRHNQISRHLLAQLSRGRGPEEAQARIWKAWRCGRDTMAVSCCQASLALLDARAPGQLLAWWRAAKPIP